LPADSVNGFPGRIARKIAIRNLDFRVGNTGSDRLETCRN